MKRNYLQETLIILINLGGDTEKYLINILRDMEKEYNLDPAPAFAYEVGNVSIKDSVCIYCCMEDGRHEESCWTRTNPHE